VTSRRVWSVWPAHGRRQAGNACGRVSVSRFAQCQCDSRGAGQLPAGGGQADLVVLGQILEDEKVRPVIDRTYPLTEVPEAIRYLEQGHAAGKIVITV